MARESDRDNADDLAALVATFRAAAREFAPTSPLYARLATEVADDDEVLALVAAAPPAQRRATLLLAAVRDLLLAEPTQPLAAWYPDLARGTVATGDPYPAFRAFCRARRDELELLLATRATQTNEVGRRAGLLPAFGVVARLAADRPLALLEVGASAGLNLRFDRYAYDYGAGRVAGDPGAAVLLSCTVRGPLPPTILDNLIAAGRIPPLVALLPDNPDPAARNRELPCHEPFVAFLADELLPWARGRYHVTADPARAIAAGSSYGGLAAAFVGLRRPDLFGNVLSQSGSFRWAPPGDPEYEWLARQYAAGPTGPLRFYVDVGAWERGPRDVGPNQVVANRHLRDVLRACGYHVRYAEYSGGHEYLCWQGTLADGLLALLDDA